MQTVCAWMLALRTNCLFLGDNALGYGQAQISENNQHCFFEWFWDCLIMVRPIPKMPELGWQEASQAIRSQT